MSPLLPSLSEMQAVPFVVPPLPLKRGLLFLKTSCITPVVEPAVNLHYFSAFSLWDQKDHEHITWSYHFFSFCSRSLQFFVICIVSCSAKSLVLMCFISSGDMPNYLIILSNHAITCQIFAPGRQHTILFFVVLAELILLNKESSMTSFAFSGWLKYLSQGQQLPKCKDAHPSAISSVAFCSILPETKFLGSWLTGHLITIWDF